MRQILRQIVAVLALVGLSMNLVPSALAATSYTDVSAANKLANAGIIVNNSANTAGYHLNDTVIRQEAVKVVAGALGGILENEANYTCTGMFSDIVAGTWVCRIAELAANAGLVFKNPTFRPTAKLSRLEAIIFALRSAGLMPAGDHSSDQILGYAVDAGLITSVAGVSINAPATRGEFFRYVAKSLDAAELPDICTLAPDLCGGGTTPPPGGGVNGNVNVMTSSANPAVMTIATGTAHNTVLAFNVANSSSVAANVTGLRLTKTGFFPTTSVSGVEVFDANGVRHGNVVTTLGSNGIAIMTFPTQPISVAAGQTVTIFVKVNLSGTSSGTIGFNVNSASDVTISGGTVGGSFPIVGNLHNIVSGAGTIGTVTLDEMAVNSTGATYNADPTASQEIAKFQVRETSSNEDILFNGLTLWNNGNASATDYKDVQLVDQTGAVVATAQPTGQTINFVLANPYLITKGQTKNFTVRATIVNGASRTIQFTVYNDYDLYVRGVSTGATLLATAGTTDTSFPIGDTTSTYNKVTIGSGSLIFNRAVDSSSSAVTPGSTDVVLAKYTAKPVGEDMELRTVSFGLDQDASAVALTGTVFVKVNGAVVYSAAANTTNFPVVGTVASRTLSSYPILTAGVDNTIEIVASISSSATTADAYFVNDMDITSVKRLISNDIVDPTVSTQDGFTRNVKAAAVTVTTLATPVAGSIVPGTNGVKLASFDLNASASGEDVRVTAVTVTDTKANGTGTAAYTDITNLVMRDASGAQITTSSSTATNANTVTFTFTNPIVVSRSATTIISLYGDVSSGAATTQTHTFKIAVAGDVTATGKDTGNTIATPSVSGSGQTQTIVSGGNLNIATDSGAGKTPSLAQIVPINSVDGVYLAARFSSQFEAQKITTLTLKATGTALVQNNLKNIRLYAQSGTGPLLGSTPAFATTNQMSSCTTNVCTYTWTATDNLLPAVIDPNTPMTIFVKADIQGENVAKLGNDFYFSILNDGTDVIAKGAVSSTAPTYDSNTAANTTAKSYINPFNVVVSGESPTNGSNTLSSVGAGTQLARFKVTNNGSAQVTLTDATFTNSGSHTGTAARYTVYASSENSNDYTANTLELSTTDTVAFGSLTTPITINGGSYRYITVAITDVTTVASGDTFSLSVASLGDLAYSVTESALGYDANQDADHADTITSLKVDGKPALGTIQKQ